MPAPLLRRDVAIGTLFALLWVAPMAHTVVLGYPSSALQANVRDLYSVTCLFRHRTTERVLFYIQVRYEDRPGYHDIDESEYFPMQPFGHRSRFDRFMARFGFRKQADAARAELAEWVATRHAQLHPEEPAIVVVRYLWTTDPIDASRPPQGHWQKPERAKLGGGLRSLGVYPVGGAEP